MPVPNELPVKIRALLPEIHNVIAKGEKALIFSNFTSFCRIGIALTQHDIKYCNIVVECLPGSRLKAVESFETNNMISCMLISTKAGGTGLNLTAANHVFIMDLWWNFSRRASNGSLLSYWPKEKCTGDTILLQRLSGTENFENPGEQTTSSKRFYAAADNRRETSRTIEQFTFYFYLKCTCTYFLKF